MRNLQNKLTYIDTHSIDTITTRTLSELNIEYTLVVHDEPVYSCKDVATVRNTKLSQVIKCMLGKGNKNEVYVMLLPGNKRLCLKKLRLTEGGLRISLFAPDEIMQRFDFVIGAISPIQLIGNARFYIDETVLLEDIIDISSGSPNAGVSMKTKDLLALINPIICDIAEV